MSASVAGEVIEFSAARQRAVVACLALASPHAVGVDRLIDQIWAHRPPQTARNSIQRFVADIRRALGVHADAIVTVSDGYRLAGPAERVDAVRAERCIAEARSIRDLDPEAASRLLREVSSLWSGPSLAGVGDVDFADRARHRLDELRVGALEDRIALDLKLERYDQVLPELEMIAAEHPDRGRVWELLILARARAGRPVDAIAAYEQHRKHLVEHHGLDPSPEVRAAHQHVLLGGAPASAPERAGREASEHLQRDLLTADGVAASLERTTPLVTPAVLAAAASSSPMIGRVDEARLVIGLLDPEPSVPQLVLLGGNAGIGKTRLAADIAQRASALGIGTVYGRCDDGFAAPYLAWRSIVRQVVDQMAPHRLLRHRREFGDVALALGDQTMAPADRPETSAGAIPTDGSSADQDVVAGAVVDLLITAARGRPLVVILDDLHAADQATLALLRYVVRQVDAPIVIVGLHRDADAKRHQGFTTLKAELAADVAVTAHQLVGLGRNDTESLVQLIVGGEAATELADALHQSTAGNPFFISEMARSLVEDAALANRSSIDGAVPIPDTVRGVIELRVGRLGERPADVLSAASVFGREFDFAVLVDVLGRDEFEVLADLEVALGAQLLIDAPEGRDRFAFAHDLLHQTLSSGLSTARRARMHAAIAAALETRHAPNIGAHAAEIAQHLIAADDPSLDERTFEFCQRAGRESMRLFAPADATSWFERATGLARKISPYAPSQLADALVELGGAQRVAVSEGARETLLEAAHVAAEANHTEALVEAVIRNSRAINGIGWETDWQRIEAGRAALAAVGTGDSIARVRVLAALLPHMWTEEFANEVAPLYRDSVAMATRIGDSAALLAALDAALTARNFRFDSDELSSHAATHSSLSRDVALGPAEFVNVMNAVATSSLQLADRAGVDDALARVDDAHERYGVAATRNAANWGASLRSGLRGDAAEYTARVLATYSHAAQLDRADIALVVFRGQMFFSHWMQGREGELVEVTATVHDGVIERPYHRALRTLVRVGAGLRDAATELLVAELTAGFAANNSIWSMYTSAIWAECAAELAHEEACGVLHDLLEPTASLMSGQFMIPLEPVATPLARLCSVLGRFDDAERHLEVAERIGRDFDGRWMLARAGLARAEMLAARGCPGDDVAAAELVVTGRAEARAAGYAGIERQFDSVGRRLEMAR